MSNRIDRHKNVIMILMVPPCESDASAPKRVFGFSIISRPAFEMTDNAPSLLPPEPPGKPLRRKYDAGDFRSRPLFHKEGP